MLFRTRPTYVLFDKLVATSRDGGFRPLEDLRRGFKTIIAGTDILTCLSAEVPIHLVTAMKVAVSADGGHIL